MMATADPDPPTADGGSTNFTGDWYVDAGDKLAYVNQTIVLTGNLTFNGTGALVLTNVTLALNSSVDGEFWIEVLRSRKGPYIKTRRYAWAPGTVYPEETVVLKSPNESSK